MAFSRGFGIINEIPPLPPNFESLATPLCIRYIKLMVRNKFQCFRTYIHILIPYL